MIQRLRLAIRDFTYRTYKTYKTYKSYKFAEFAEFVSVRVFQ